MEEKIKELNDEIEKLEKEIKTREKEMDNKEHIDDEKDYGKQYIYANEPKLNLLKAELKGYLLGQSDTKKEIEYRLKESNMQYNFECGVKIGVEQGQSDYKKKVEDVIKKLKEDIKLNWKHYQYNYNPAGSEKRKKELLNKIDNLLKELEIKC